MRLRARTCLVLTALLSALPIGAQPAIRDDRDLDLLPAGRYDTVDRVTPVDIETDEVGRLVVAYGLNDSYYGTASVEVRMRDKNAVGWTQLASLSIDPGPGGGTRVKAVSVATGIKLNGIDKNDMAFVAVVFSRGGSDFLAYYEGPIKSAWPYKDPNQAILASGAARTSTDPLFLNPSIAVIGEQRANFNKYDVGIAYTKGLSGGQGEARLLWMSPGNGYRATDHLIVGPNGGPVQGSFGRPSLTWDKVNGVWGVAVEKLGSQRVHVIAGKAGTAPSQLNAVYASNPDTPRHHPMLDSNQGHVNLTMLGASLTEGASWELHWASGQLFDASSFAEFAKMHDGCRTPGDLDLRSETGYVVADCWDSAARRFRVTGFEIRRSVAVPPSVVATVNDVSATPHQPRIAVAPSGAPVDYAAIAYTTEVQFPVPGGPSGRDALLIDP